MSTYLITHFVMVEQDALRIVGESHTLRAGQGMRNETHEARLRREIQQQCQAAGLTSERAVILCEGDTVYVDVDATREKIRQTVV